MIYIDIKDRKDYLDILGRCKNLTHKIQIVQIDGPVKNDPLFNKAYELLHLEGKDIVNSWFSTVAESSRGAVQYTFGCIRNRREFFGYLASLDSFFDSPDIGTDDIAFYDEKGELLFYTVTHEEDAYLSEKLV